MPSEIEAKRIITETFQEFDEVKFKHFIVNLLNEANEEKALQCQGKYIKDAFKPYIKQYKRLCQYTDPEGNVLDVLTVHLVKESSLERARTMQRNFVADYLKSRGSKSSALVAYYTDNKEDWRFSFVKVDYKLIETDEGKYKPTEEFTPSKRYSFLVGIHEPNHTAQQQLISLVQDDKNNPTLDDLEKAFNIESVTAEFFNKYRDLFIWTKEEFDRIIEKDKLIKDDFEKKGVNTVDLAKKLLGQIIFLYYLQKKGWFGVSRDGEWGSGSKGFLRELFEKKHELYNNFFNDILEPLFYEALRIDRNHDDSYYSRFNCKIPFLNGGLFDPLNNYDWVHTDILLSNELFSNDNKTKEGYTGNGILDIFDRYNFTVKEDEPLEKEVAIDPELLGKAYEKFNAIRPDNFQEYLRALKSGKKGEESKFNKQYGVYYTPREIVHYMCQQSLINYLFTELNGINAYEQMGNAQYSMLDNMVKKGQLDLTITHNTSPEILKEDIEKFVYFGEQLIENEEIALLKEQKITEGKQKSTDYISLLPVSISKYADIIDQKLSSITVCDPAVGSGAFPVGMMSEIVRARNALNPYIKTGNRSMYQFKRACIEHSLYGVDIDHGAVEIAKLRLWLSLVVDEDEINNIKPLPNLDYKIVCGNTLIGFPDNWESAITKEIESLKDAFTNETNPTKKINLKKQIDGKINLRYQNSLKNFGYEVNFDFRTVFSEVFSNKAGFNIVIANPPYVTSGKITDIKPALKKVYSSFYCGTADLYTYFIQKGIALTNSTGCLCYITSNKFMRASYGKNTRELLTKKAAPIIIIDFGELPVFEAATDPSIVLVSRKVMPNGNFTAITIKTEKEIANISNVVKERGFIMPISALSIENWILENQRVLTLKEKLKQKGIPLSNLIKGQLYRGILTGFNEAFIIDEDKKNNLIAEDRVGGR
ncbi:MAG: class I SAM-dependent DNA methyltransferase [Candidatus Margulisiibacteriota bacterium]|nr:MAG: class I SAM-dependent DNA methyltransferase [Candidatus Margulisiibacteriota bacterium]HCY35979.1 restriction endonuclease [Candidatus Margulisiibacteriota bacterium]